MRKILENNFVNFLVRNLFFLLMFAFLILRFLDVKMARSQKCLYFNAKKNPKNVFKNVFQSEFI